ncbi:MAG: HD domain-containing protein [Candidatus Omnitrophica bacterium]|nr:HD domain-containing protein [Candidatus Omnitrophota bacterium]MDD3274311.1 HD domain-containing protein [Candidatus Omnitrophota bacterium]MDD5077389.1 HD domain-containing protein [Candidatus Omnitrophota bacterium]MDD5724813.1 HD domain-containing protein [Candidatus Omnitrophota bacterium]
MNIKNYSTPTKKYRFLISAVHSIYRLLNSTYEVHELISRMGRLFCQFFNAQYCQVVLLDLDKKYSLAKCTIKDNKKTVLYKRARIYGRVEEKIIRTSSAFRKGNLLGVPLISEDTMGFVIIRRNPSGAPFDIFDQEMLMTMSEQAVVGIKNMQLYEEQQRIVVGSIKSLVKFLDTRVSREYTHSPHFSKLVCALGAEVHLNEKQLQSLKYASLLHDAGKVDIPAAILTKTTKLTDAEYDIIKKHPVKGAQILRPLQVLRPAIPIIMYHHEKYNGTGYPSQLKGGQIPLGARIMSVADAFEAMVYGRPYRQRMDISSAIKEIKRKSGTQFDPKIVEAFLTVIKKFNKKIYLHQDA